MIIMDLKKIGRMLQKCALPAKPKPDAVLRHCVRMQLIVRQKGSWRNGCYVTTQLGHEILLRIAYDLLN